MVKDLIAPNFDTKRNKFIAANPECGMCGSKLKYCGIKVLNDVHTKPVSDFAANYAHKLSLLPMHSVLGWYAENRSQFTLDHIVPKSLGGANSYRNYQVLCHKCNSAVKGNSITAENWEIYKERCASMKKIDKNKIEDLIK